MFHTNPCSCVVSIHLAAVRCGTTLDRRNRQRGTSVSSWLLGGGGGKFDGIMSKNKVSGQQATAKAITKCGVSRGWGISCGEGGFKKGGGEARYPPIDSRNSPGKYSERTASNRACISKWDVQYVSEEGAGRVCAVCM